MKIRIPYLGVLAQAVMSRLKVLNSVQQEVKAEIKTPDTSVSIPSQPAKVISRIPDEPDEYTFKALAALKMAADLNLEIKRSKGTGNKSPEA